MQLSEEKERVANYRPVCVTEIADTLHFYAQDVETGMSYLWLLKPGSNLGYFITF